jgi:choline dehydrogenase-like flavoprotein
VSRSCWLAASSLLRRRRRSSSQLGQSDTLIAFGLYLTLKHSGLKSSQLLELSGIGDSTILERLDIPVRIDLPSVGENVQGSLVSILLSSSRVVDIWIEHTIGSVSWELKDSILFDTLDILRDPKVAEEHIKLLYV